jgi:hypothetical protein
LIILSTLADGADIAEIFSLRNLGTEESMRQPFLDS